MQLQTFKAQSMAECLSQVKTAMGGDAIILHTRTYQSKHWLGLRKKEVVEITAGKGMNIGRRPRPNPGDGPPDTNGKTPPRGGGPNGTPSGTYDRRGIVRTDEDEPPRRRRESPPEPPANVSPKHLLDTPAATSAAVIGLTQEVTTVKQMLKELLEVSRKKQAPDVPSELSEYFDLLVNNNVCPTIAQELIRTLQRQVRAEHHGQADLMRAKLAELIEKQLPLGGPIAKAKSGKQPAVVALVGPTGVGKTTTIAKLAAKLKLEQGQRIGLITLDTYRIAAVDQLRRYAEILGAPLKVVRSTEELQEAMESMRDLDYVLIDTAGRSPKDKLKINELKSVLEVASPDEVHLVLSTTACEGSLELAVRQFDEVRVDRVILTKLDEAATLGVVLNVVRKVNKSISYITTGQDVPDDIEIARGPRLARLVLGEEL